MNNKETIAKALSSPEEEVRLQAMRKVAELDPTEGLDLIFQGFGDQSWRVRKQAIDLFLTLPMRQELIGDIIELLHAEENAGLRNAAVETLTRLGRDAVPFLLDQAFCPDHDVRKFIVDILGDIGDQRAIPVLIKGLSDTDSNVRAAAAENLGKLQASEGVLALLKAMEYPDLLLQFTILDALSRIGAPVDFAQLRPYKDEKLLRKALMDCLGKVGDASSIEELIVSLNDSMRNVREAALRALAHIANRHPEEVRAALGKHLSGPLAETVATFLAADVPADLQAAAIRVSGWLAAEPAIPRLLDLLNVETHQQASLAALVDIGRIRPDGLIRAWSSVSPQQRAYLAYVFGEAGCRAGDDLLLGALATDDLQLRCMAVYALGKLGDVVVLPELIQCLRDDAEVLQEAATQALIALGTRYEKETLAALQPIMDDGDFGQRKAVTAIVSRFRIEGIMPVLNMALKDPHADVRREAVKAFEGREIDDYLSSLLLALTDEDAEVRRTAVDILGKSGHEDAFEGLQLALRDEDIWVRSSAVRGLGRIGGVQAISLIEAALNDPVGLVSIAALETLSALLGEKVCPMLVNALDHKDEEVVSASLQLLASCDDSQWLSGHVQALINHPFWAVRCHFARFAVQHMGAEAADILAARLSVETEELVRQQLQDLLEEIKG